MLEKTYNPKICEQKWTKYWSENNIYKFNIESNKEIFSIDTPPPTVSGKIHIGHVFSYLQVEMIARFWRMLKKEIFYPFGFDNNGLPTERLVEKKHNIKAYNMKREEFNELCLQTTTEYELKYKELFQSLGFSVDWSLEYSTISSTAQKISQKSFIDLYKTNKLYYSNMPALWCTECQTSIAQAEIDTKELETTFNYLKFEIVNSNENLIIATTRPELLYACVCIFINPDDKQKSHLIGQKACVPIFNFEVPILSDQKVDIEKGTGAVMCCTFGDMVDIDWWRRYKLPLKNIITKYGRLTKDVKNYADLTLSQARKKIIEDAKNLGALEKIENIIHAVGVHERCNTVLEFIICKQWFIKILENKQLFLDAAEKINWFPHYMKSRYINWVENLQWDWCISRQRYFGVPFPLWYCADCKAIILANESKLPVNPLVDKPDIKCQCGSEKYIPEQDIMDTWATSAVTPLINIKWSINDNLKKVMPMSLRPNSHDIIRTWDFYTIVKNLYHLNEIPWKNIMISGFVLAERGNKISKSKENTILAPEELISQYSADIVRYWAAKGRLGTDILFSKDELNNGARLVTKIWNSSRFALMHLADFADKNNIKLEVMDTWLLMKLKEQIDIVCDYLKKFEVGLALESIEKFFWYFCDNYIELVKHRLYKPEIYGAYARISGQKTLFVALFNILKMFSIYLPFVCEEIYQQYFKNIINIQSIHLLEFNDFKFNIDKEFIKNGDFVIEIISQLRKYKTEAKLALNSELNKVEIKLDQSRFDFVLSIQNDLKAICNIKELIILNDEKCDNCNILTINNCCV